MKTPVVKIGKVKIGGKNPIAIQSMTNTPTSNMRATLKQCRELIDSGAEIIRVTVDDEAAAEAIPKIRKKMNADVPLVGDFHFNGDVLLEKFSECAKSLDKYRINPGNARDKGFKKIIEIAVENKKPVRIGVNTGSVPAEENPIKLTLDSAKLAEKYGLKRNQIVLSLKASCPNELIKLQEGLVSAMVKSKKIYAIHLGLTEAGRGIEAIVKSTAAMAILLREGIGDTIRVSLTPQKSRSEEVRVARQILQSLGLRKFASTLTSCPGCGRANNRQLQRITREVQEFLDKNQATKSQSVAVMGCIVNGPGEARNKDIALVLPGKKESKIAQVYVKGKLYKTLTGKNITRQFIEILKKSQT